MAFNKMSLIITSKDFNEVNGELPSANYLMKVDTCYLVVSDSYGELKNNYALYTIKSRNHMMGEVIEADRGIIDETFIELIKGINISKDTYNEILTYTLLERLRGRH